LSVISSFKKGLFTKLIFLFLSSLLLILSEGIEYKSDSYFIVSAQKSDQIILNQNQTNILSLRTLIQNGSPYQGNISAPLTVIDFSDFQCYLCNRYIKNTEPLLNETYIQSGKVALVFKHLPNRGFDSMGAALAAQCTNDQGKFWQFHNLLYGNQKQIDSGWVSKENLKKFSSQIHGIDIQKFDSCLDTAKYKAFIQNDVKLASSFGFKETPSFIIVNNDGSNPEFLQGALPFPSFEAVIDKKLSEGGNGFG
jgi:protein-disulfide isomerase